MVDVLTIGVVSRYRQGLNYNENHAGQNTKRSVMMGNCFGCDGWQCILRITQVV